MKKRPFNPADIYDDEDFAPRRNTRSPKQKTKTDDSICEEYYNPKNERQNQYDKRINGEKKHRRRD